ncbi:MAG: hypothetical protein F6K04_15635 [Leptolyngbya sp. SIO4C5]|uniref:NfeD family protein n=1 Tax=Sphaerothrix gracilis TaxID=3151835 RepID=UPI0013C1B0CA|nr:hypothetical protein [Leptolyngbya sp. SIO4C5]
MGEFNRLFGLFGWLLTTQTSSANDLEEKTQIPTVDQSDFDELHPLYPNQDRAAVIANEIRPGQIGRVKYQASWWKARCEQNIFLPSETAVRVVGRQGLTLLVEPDCIQLREAF